MTEADEGERRAAPVAEARAERPHPLEQPDRLLDVPVGEGEIREPCPDVCAATLAPGQLESLQRLREQGARPGGVGGGACDVGPVEQDVAGGDGAADLRERLQRVLEHEAERRRIPILHRDLCDVDERRHRLAGITEAGEELVALRETRLAAARSPATHAATPSE